MLKRTEWRIPVCILAFCLVLTFLIACGSKERYAGTYKADLADSAKQGEATVELKINGEGKWKFGDEEVPFSWDVKEDQLRVNTKGGGIIVGSMQNGVLNITLPNSRTMAFKKIQ